MEVLSGFDMVLSGVQMDLGGFWRISGGSGGGDPSPALNIRPPKEGRICGEVGICGEVSRVEVGRLRRSIRNAVRARRGGGYVDLLGF